MLAVALHLQLLEIGGKAPEPLVVGDHAVRGVAEDVAVPDAEQPHQDRNVPLDRRLAEMLVDLVAAAQKFVEAVRPDRDRQRQADARPDRIAAADPIPEAEHARRLDAELRHLVELRRDGGEMVADGRFADALARSRRGRSRRWSSSPGGEGLRGDDEQGARRIESAQRVADVGAVDVGDEMAAQIAAARTAPSARVAMAGPRSEPPMPILMTSVIGWPSAPRTRPSRTSAAKLSIFSRTPMTSGITSLPSTRTGLPSKLRKRRVQHGALLGRVDLLASEHRLALGLDLGGLGELDERSQNACVDALLRIIEQEIVKGDAELLEARRIVGEIRSRGARQHALAHAGQFRQCR